MKTFKTMFAAAALALAATSSASAGVLLTENFDNVGDLTGWLQSNESAPVGQSWYQGNDGVFAAHAGADNSYISADYLSAANGFGAIDNWLITPEVSNTGMTTISFFTRSVDVGPGFNDTMEVRYSAGNGTATSGFTSLLGTVGGASQYDNGWTKYTFSVNAEGSGRFAFRYTGDAGSANYIGVDSVRVTAVPEPEGFAMMGLGLAALALVRRKQSKKAA